MKIVVYTCITGNYDSLRKFKNSHNTDIDFICFTDNQNLTFNDKGWTIKPIPSDLKELSKIKQQRLIKILPNRYLKEYDISLWVDGNIEILCDVNDFLNTLDFEKYHFYTRKHPSRDCIYDEAKSVLKFGKDSLQNVDSQMNGYQKEGFPKHFGLAETCIIARKHNELDCQLLDNKWASELVGKSHRDQLSFDYSRWKTGIEIGYFKLNRLTNDEKFRWRKHGTCV